jgi:hypothetical protein
MQPQSAQPANLQLVAARQKRPTTLSFFNHLQHHRSARGEKRLGSAIELLWREFVPAP